MREQWKKRAVDILVDLIGGLLLAAAIYSFAVPADFPMTGVSGIALIFYHLFGLPVGTITVLLNIPIAVCCYRTLGKKFYLNSLKTVLITSAVMDIAGPLLPLFEGDPILAAISAGVLMGVGYGIIFMRGSSTGGFDFIIMAVRYYHPHLSVGNIAFLMDTCVILGSGVLIGSSGSNIIYGLVLNYLLARVLDKVVYGTNSGKLTLIITEFPQEIVQEIDKMTGRGATILKGVGGFSGESKEVVMCASSNKEMYEIRKRVHEVDERAFVIIMESNDVVGEGFRLPGDDTLV